MSIKTNEVLLSLEDICKYFKVSGGTLKAVDHVSFDIHKGETMGLVGESGCGKSTLGRVAMGIYPATSGKLSYKGQAREFKARQGPLQLRQGGPDHLPGPLRLPGPPHDRLLHHRGGHGHPQYVRRKAPQGAGV